MRPIWITADQLEYSGLFVAPAFTLIAQPEVALEGLYYAFLGMHGGLDAIAAHAEAPSVESVWEIDLGEFGTYRLGISRIDWVRTNAWTVELDTALLARGDAWLRSALPASPMHSHHYTYSGHAHVMTGTARDVLIDIGAPKLAGVGVDQGSGIIFHGKFQEGWSVRLTVDHSQVVEDGLFVQIVASTVADTVDHASVGRFLLHLANTSLQQLGLRVENGVG